MNESSKLCMSSLPFNDGEDAMDRRRLVHCMGKKFRYRLYYHLRMCIPGQALPRIGS
jgi:hypothetical protein